MKQLTVTQMTIVIEKIKEKCGQVGFENIDEHNCSYMTMEYAVPEFIGNMVRVKYKICIVLSNHIGVELSAVMFNRPYDAEINTNMNPKCIEIYNDEVAFNMDGQFDEWCDYIVERIHNMFDRVDEKLKNIFGMERVA